MRESIASFESEEIRERLDAASLLARIGEPDKHWKFSAGDARERRHWDDYQRAFEGTEAIQRLRKKLDVQILTEKLPTEEALIHALSEIPA